MAKPKAGRCVHCLQTVEAITEDHLFPKSWYPETTPPDLEKWTIPACGPCNSAHGENESELRLLLAACVDPKSEAAVGIWQKALDSINPAKGKSPLDIRMRELTRRKFTKKLRPADGVPMQHVLPELDPNRPKGGLALHVPAQGLRKFVDKLVRGTVWVTERRYIEGKDVRMSFIRLEDAEEVFQIFERFGELYERGPGIRIRKAVAPELPSEPIFVFDIWNQFRVYAYLQDVEARGRSPN
jgi:hypothetical protein